ncbi:mitochondrial-processing peptidase subunit [Musa troglodytarum]|uniref:Mitochondrial-processing peptidase subunit n=1 Tax=Musa troglodytarum TaxID=320322 RepID=A0A9E7IAP2_9LILI|nr:mitochondrial-processing peptidase subunit [Musa troglodytarum]
MQAPVESCGAAFFSPEVMDEGLRDRSRGATLPRVSEDGNDLSESSSFCGDSDDSVSSSSSSSNAVEDTTSSASSGALRLDSQGPLFELSSLVAQLPIKRGLSRYFQGKSQSFTSLSDVRCIEDLAKKETPYGKRMKTCRSYAAGLDAAQRPCFTPGPRRKSLAKKTSRGPCASLLARSSSIRMDGVDRLRPKKLGVAQRIRHQHRQFDSWGVRLGSRIPNRRSSSLSFPRSPSSIPSFGCSPPCTELSDLILGPLSIITLMRKVAESSYSLSQRQSGGARIFDTAARFASTSIAKRSSGGFFGWRTGGSSFQLPLDFPLPCVSLPPLPDFVEPARTKITTLPNGLKIASEVSTTPSSFGATHLLERMAFKTTKNRSHLRLVREIEAIGGSVAASGSREQMGYTYDALKTYMPEMVEVLIDSVRNAVFLDWEVNKQLKKVKAEIGELSSNPQGLLLEAIHSAAYSGALANPLIAPESVINRLDGTILEEFVADNYTAPRMVLAASGVEHEELVSIAEPLLSDLPKVPHLEEPKSVYIGGEYRCRSDSSKTHVALAFEVPGGWHKEKEAMALTVLQMLMGGGGSFSAGGPGKGMHSRLFFDVTLDQGPEFVSKAVELAVREMLAVATPGQVDQLQLDRAKDSTKSAVLMNLESRMVASEDIGRQILTYGERKRVEHFLKAVDELTIKDLTSLAEKAIEKVNFN